MSQKLYLVDINLNGNQLKSAVVEQLTGAPENPKAGQLYFDTTLNKLCYFNGSAWQHVIEYTYDENSFIQDDFEKGKLTVKNVLNDDEKALLESQLFNTKFNAKIVASPSSVTFAGNTVNVTYTLTTIYGENAVDLDSVPAGWTRTETGKYTKAATIDASTGASISSGVVSCTYHKLTKSSNSASVTNYKKSYILYSSKAALTADDLTSLDTTGTVISGSNSIAGDKTLKATVAGQYAYFIIANTSRLSNVTQLGVSILDNTTGVELTRSGYGSYKVYRTGVALGTAELAVKLV